MSTKKQPDPNVGRVIEIKWGTSRGRDSYGYITATLYENGERLTGCNGGGYDMRGTVIGNWIAGRFAEQLRRLPLKRFPERSHWEREDPAPRLCRMIACLKKRGALDLPEVPRLAPDVLICPDCGEETEIDHQAGRRVQDGRGFYGLTFHDPTYDPGKAIIGKDCNDRTMSTKSNKGKTVAEAEKAGESLGLERYQAIYSASSPTPTKRHTHPSIDGACGLSSVRQIFNALGYDLRQIVDRAKLNVYEVVRFKK